MAGSSPRHIKFLALATGGRLLASHTHWDKEGRENYKETLLQIFASAGWQAIRAQNKTKLELKSGGNVYCLELDGERVFCAVLTSAYPIRHIFSASAASGGGAKLMRDFAEHVSAAVPRESLSAPPGGLQRALARFLEGLAARYDDVEGIDKLARVQGSVKALQGTMANNLRLADERHTLLDREVDKTQQLAETSKSLFKRTAGMRSIMRCRRWTVILSIALIALAAAAIITIVLVGKFATHWW